MEDNNNRDNQKFSHWVYIAYYSIVLLILITGLWVWSIKHNEKARAMDRAMEKLNNIGRAI